MITLRTLKGTDRVESFSPFCMKVEVYLKLANLPYRAVVSDPRRAPKKKLPVIEDGGRTIADSGDIVAYLEDKHGEPLDRGLDATSRGKAHLVCRTLEESLYFVLLWSRWVEDEAWTRVTRGFFDELPAPLRLFVPGLVRKKMIGTIYAQGTGRHSRDEIYARGVADLAAIATAIGDGPFVLGDRLRTIDTAAYAFLANVACVDVDSPLRAHVLADRRLSGYVDRVGERVRAATPAAS